jgi:hypothetical protein
MLNTISADYANRDIPLRVYLVFYLAVDAIPYLPNQTGRRVIDNRLNYANRHNANQRDIARFDLAKVSGVLVAEFCGLFTGHA